VRDRPRPLLHHPPRNAAAAVAMSFLFGKKSKQPSNALPPATREITSSHGPGQPPPAAVNGAASRDVEKPRGGPSSQTSTPGGSVNNSLSSLQNPANAPTPEPKALREKTDTNIQARAITSPRAAPVLTATEHEPQICRQLARLALPLVLPTPELHRR
jgi:hypothetical protein